jgi:hypothetical protein
MSTSVELPVAGLREEAVWQTWVAKGRARERQGSATRVKIVKAASAAVLLITAAFASDLAPFELIIRFLVALGAVVVMFQEFHARHYAIAVVFGALALVYNPAAPVFGFAGDWQRVVVAASAIPFIASLASRDAATGDRHV